LYSLFPSLPLVKHKSGRRSNGTDPQNVFLVSRASIPFSLPDFTIVLSELWNEIRGWHFIVETVELRAAFAASSARSLPQISV